MLLLGQKTPFLRRFSDMLTFLIIEIRTCYPFFTAGPISVVLYLNGAVT